MSNYDGRHALLSSPQEAQTQQSSRRYDKPTTSSQHKAAQTHETSTVKGSEMWKKPSRATDVDTRRRSQPSQAASTSSSRALSRKSSLTRSSNTPRNSSGKAPQAAQASKPTQASQRAESRQSQITTSKPSSKAKAKATPSEPGTVSRSTHQSREASDSQKSSRLTQPSQSTIPERPLMGASNPLDEDSAESIKPTPLNTFQRLLYSEMTPAARKAAVAAHKERSIATQQKARQVQASRTASTASSRAQQRGTSSHAPTEAKQSSAVVPSQSVRSGEAGTRPFGLNTESRRRAAETQERVSPPTRKFLKKGEGHTR